MSITDRSDRPGSTYQRRAEVLFGAVDGDVVIADLDRGKYHWLNTTGARIWELLETPRTQGEICAALCREHEVEHDVCERQVTDFLRALDERGALVRRP